MAKLFEWYATGDPSLKDIGLMVRQAGFTNLKSGAAFSGLIQCGHCGCSMVGQVKKGRHVYYHCSGYQGKCTEPYAREELIERQFADLLRGLSPRAGGPGLGHQGAGTRASATRSAFTSNRSSRLQAELAQLDKRLEGMHLDKLDGRVNAAFYARNSNRVAGATRSGLQGAIERPPPGQPDLRRRRRPAPVAGQPRPQPFLKQATEKRVLLQFVVSNSTWRDGRLSISYRPPFNLILDGISQAVKSGPTDSQVPVLIDQLAD